jgi:RNA polymerase sigma-70 factor (ECF subfamily)
MSTSQKTDISLAKAQKLDKKTLINLHEHYFDSVASYIRFKVSDPEAAADLSSEVFVRALEALHAGRGWHTSPKSWLLGIARYVVIDYYRQQGQIEQVNLEGLSLVSETEDKPHQHTLFNEDSRTLQAALKELTQAQKQVIFLRFMQGLSTKHTAKLMDKTPGAIKGLQHRALKALKNQLTALTSMSD